MDTHFSNLLGNYIAGTIMDRLNEDVQEKPIAVYVGRFQPFHKGHYSIYKHLVEKFGQDRVFIGTSNATDAVKSPFTFDEKKKIITTLFHIPADRIVQVKNPYAPIEITSRFPDSTPIVTAVSEKDADRLTNSKYFTIWDGKSKGGYKDVGHLIIAPVFKMDVDGENISGTQVRKVLGGNASENEKRKMFTALYGSDSPEMFKMITGKLATTQSTPKVMPKISRNIPKTIVNPETKRKILIKTALGYDKNHPVRRAAEKLLHRENVLLEGGAAGHLMHPYEDTALLFSQLKDMIQRAAQFELHKEGVVTEKTDGQNLMFTVKQGHVLFARNKSHVKNRAQSALTINDLHKMFSGRGEISDSFSSAAEDLQAAISAAPHDFISNMFGEGQTFMNLEVINPETKNVIPYDRSILQFHGTVQFDDAGNRVDTSPENGIRFSEMIRSIGAAQQKKYGLQGPQIISFSTKQKEMYQDRLQSYIDYLEELQKKFGLDDTATLQDYLNRWWDRAIREQAKKNAVTFTDDEIGKLVQRWAGGIKNIGKKDFSDPRTIQFFEMVESQYDQLKKISIQPIETVMLKVGAAVIAQSTDTIAANNPAAADSIKSKVKKIIQRISTDSSLSDKLTKLNTELSRLNATGGVEGIKPVEGLVFVYNGRLYKFTGAFAPVNQILGMLGFEAKRDDVSQTATVLPGHKKTRSSRTDMLDKTILNPKTKNKILVRTALSYDKQHPAYRLARQQLGLPINEQFNKLYRGYHV